MLKGIYIAASGAVMKQAQLEVITQNIANVDTAGFKKDALSFRDYLIPTDTPTLMPDGRAMTYLGSMKTDFSAGNIVRTNNPFDIAINGSGFIALEGERYTKRGDFKKDSEGSLTTAGGVKVLGSSGQPIALPEGPFEIDSKGSISVNGAAVGTIKVVDFENTETLSKSGDSMFSSAQAGTESKSSVVQGYIEKSNVDVVKDMVRMISAMREFEAYQKIIQGFDEVAAKVNNEIGRF